MFFNTPELKVGVMVIAVASIIGIMSMKVVEGPGMLSGANTYWFELESAGGLLKRSSVKAAGINVGVIDRIKLENGKARIYITIENMVHVTKNSAIEIRSDGILGDKHVEVVTGDIKEAALASGSQIETANMTGSLDSLISQISSVTHSVRNLVDILNNAATGEGDPTNPVGRIILNIERLTEDLSEVTSNNKGKINEIVDQVHSLTATLDEMINDDGNGGLQETWKKTLKGLARIDKTMENLEAISDKINRGEGTLGRLVNDEETIDEINMAVHKVNEFLGGADELETSIDFHSEYLGRIGKTKSYLTLRMQPGLDRYYELGIADDPTGLVQSKTIRSSVNGGLESLESSETTYKDRVKFTALFAKNYYNMTVKGGIMESSGGVGFDYHLMGRRLRFSVEAFDFEEIYLRSFLRYNFFKGVYIVGGGDDLMDKHNRAGGFLGAGLFLTNEDLKILASKMSF